MFIQFRIIRILLRINTALPIYLTRKYRNLTNQVFDADGGSNWQGAMSDARIEKCGGVSAGCQQDMAPQLQAIDLLGRYLSEKLPTIDFPLEY